MSQIEGLTQSLQAKHGENNRLQLQLMEARQAMQLLQGNWQGRLAEVQVRMRACSGHGCVLLSTGHGTPSGAPSKKHACNSRIFPLRHGPQCGQCHAHNPSYPWLCLAHIHAVGTAHVYLSAFKFAIQTLLR